MGGRVRCRQCAEVFALTESNRVAGGKTFDQYESPSYDSEDGSSARRPQADHTSKGLIIGITVCASIVGVLGIVALAVVLSMSSNRATTGTVVAVQPQVIPATQLATQPFFQQPATKPTPTFPSVFTRRIQPPPVEVPNPPPVEPVPIDPEPLMPLPKVPAKKIPVRPPVRPPVEPNADLDDLIIKNLPNAVDILPCVMWGEDGKHFYTLTKQSKLSKIDAETLETAKSIELPQQVKGMSMSAKGLVVNMGVGKLQMVDPDELTLGKRWDVPAADVLASSPALNIALAGARQDPNRTAIVDLNTGKLTAFRGSVKHGIFTPDGKYFFAETGEHLERYRVKGSLLTPDLASDRIAQNGQTICVSPDSKYVCLPSGGGNYKIPAVDAKPYTTYVYNINNLRQPEFVLESGAYPEVVGFDPKSKRIYAQNHDKNLIVFSDVGVQRKGYRIWGDIDIRQFVVSPQGGKLLILGSKSFGLVEVK